MTRTRLASLLLLATVMVWGSTFVLVKAALEDCTPLLFNLLRMAFAMAILAAVNHRSLRLLSRNDLRAGAACGFFLALGYQLQTVGLARTDAVKSAFLTGLIVLFVPAFLLFPALRPAGVPRPHWQAGVGALLAFAGILLLTTPAGTPFIRLFATMGGGDLLTLGCAVAFAAHLITMAHVAKRVPAGLLATLQIGVATLFMSATLPFEHSHARPTPRLFLALAVCAILATAIAFTVQSFAQQVLPPAHTALLCTLEPVFGALASFAFLHESLGSRALLGAAAILSAVALVELTSPVESAAAPA